MRYQARYSGSLQPNAPPMNSQPVLMPYQSRPIAHTSWKALRRCHHWSKTIAAKAKLSTDDPSGSTMFSVFIRVSSSAIQGSVEDLQAFVQLRLCDAQRRVGHDRVPAHEREHAG